MGAGAASCWELGFVAALPGGAGGVGGGAHRLARLLLLLTANVCVFAGALLFTEPSGGVLPLLRAGGAAAAAVWPGRVAAGRRWAPRSPRCCSSPCKTGLAAAIFSRSSEAGAVLVLRGQRRRRRSSLAFLVPFFFYRSNLRAEASLRADRTGEAQAGDRRRPHRRRARPALGPHRGRQRHVPEPARLHAARIWRPGALDLTAIAPRRRSTPTSPATGRAAELRAELGLRADLPAQGRHDRADAGRRRAPRRERRRGGRLRPRSDGAEARRSPAGHAAESQEALRLRDLFNSIASHELKTPLTALHAQPPAPARRGSRRRRRTTSPLRAQVERCESAAARMGELIHALLDVAQIHDGRLTLTVHDIDVGRGGPAAW